MLNSKEYALKYFEQEDDSLFALIAPVQWLEFANQYGMCVSQNSGKPIVSGSLPLADALSFAEWTDINAVRNGQSKWKYKGDNFKTDYSTIELLKIYQGGTNRGRADTSRGSDEIL